MIYKNLVGMSMIVNFIFIYNFTFNLLANFTVVDKNLDEVLK